MTFYKKFYILQKVVTIREKVRFYFSFSFFTSGYGPYIYTIYSYIWNEIKGKEEVIDWKKNAEISKKWKQNDKMIAVHSTSLEFLNQTKEEAKKSICKINFDFINKM